MSALRLEQIMVPIDFSVCSRKAVDYAVALARDYHANLVLIHVVETKQATQKIIHEREIELETLAWQEVRNQVPVTTLIRVGEPLREIIDLARAGLVDLLLISTHGRSGLADFCLGSGAEQIVRYAPCPVLVVREQEHDFIRDWRPSPEPCSKRSRRHD